MSRLTRTGLTAFAAIVLLAGSASAMTIVDFVSNGDFETGDFSGWTVTSSGSALSWTINDGTFDPAGSGGVLAPISGAFDAVSSQTGPGQNILSESFVVPNGVLAATLAWSDRIRNFGGVFSDPNQEWRVLIEDAGSGALLHEVFSTNPGDPLSQIGPNHRSFDLTTVLSGLEGQAVRVSFEQQDNLGFFNATLDNVSFQVATPEPGTLGLLALGLAGLGFAYRRRSAK